MHIYSGIELITLNGQLDRFALMSKPIAPVVKSPQPVSTVPYEFFPSIEEWRSKTIDALTIDKVLAKIKTAYINNNFSLVVNKKRGEFIWRIDPPNPKFPYKQLSSAKEDQYGHFLDIFCEIIRGKAPAYMLFADNGYIGMFSHSLKSTLQQTKILVIPKKHTHSIMTLTNYLTESNELRALLKRGQEAAESLGSTTYTLSINRGLPLQQVPHVHLHVEMTHDSPLQESILDSLKKEILKDKNAIVKQGPNKGKENRNWNVWEREAFISDHGMHIMTWKSK